MASRSLCPFGKLAAIAMVIVVMHWGMYTAVAQSSTAVPAAKGSTDALIPARSRKPAPDFTLTDVQGRTITLSQYKGKVVLLDFWATTCGGCKIEIPWYVEFDGKYGGNGLALIGIDMYGESPGVVKAFMAKSGMKYPVAIGTDAIGNQFGVKALPLTLLIDRSGRIAVSHVGIVNQAEFQQDIEELLR